MSLCLTTAFIFSFGNDLENCFIPVVVVNIDMTSLSGRTFLSTSAVGWNPQLPRCYLPAIAGFRGDIDTWACAYL
jgi:hypothetical protein